MAASLRRGLMEGFFMRLSNLVWCVALLLLGCQQKAKEPEYERNARGQIKGGLRETIARQGVFGELHDFGLWYQQYTIVNGTPKRLEDIKAELGKENARVYKAIADGYYVVNWAHRDGASDSVIAYEKDADKNGQRFVLRGDYGVQKMNQADLDKALAQQ
jgi:hypothetical protein